MPDAHYHFSHLAALTDAVSAMGGRHREEMRKVMGEWHEANDACVAILRHNGRQSVCSESHRFVLMEGHRPSVDARRLSEPGVHDLELPPGLNPANPA